MVRYRDRKTGRFVSKAKWRRSRSRTGKRYVRESAALPKSHVAPKRKTKRERLRPRELPEPTKKRKLPKPILEEPFEDEDAEYGGAFDSP